LEDAKGHGGSRNQSSDASLLDLGVPESVAMKISGHKTRQVFERYDIIDESDIREAGRKLNEKQKSNALLEIAFGHGSGMISPKTGYSDDSEAATPQAQLPN
jgi:hypothetical protein